MTARLMAFALIETTMALRLPTDATRCALHVALAGCLSCGAPAAFAVSGGGKDFSGASIESQDFSGQQLKGKEFRGTRGAKAIFAGAQLSSTSFFQADLSQAVFKGADMTGASLEEAGLDGADLRDAVLVNAYFTRTSKLFLLVVLEPTIPSQSYRALSLTAPLEILLWSASRGRREDRWCRLQRGHHAREDAEAAVWSRRCDGSQLKDASGNPRFPHVSRLKCFFWRRTPRGGRAV
jgi:hypothetical protein